MEVFFCNPEILGRSGIREPAWSGKNAETFGGWGGMSELPDGEGGIKVLVGRCGMRILGRGNKSKYGNLPAWGRMRKPLAGEAGCRNFRLRRAGYGNLPVRPAGHFCWFYFGAYVKFCHRLCVWRCCEFFILIHVVFSWKQSFRWREERWKSF